MTGKHITNPIGTKSVKDKSLNFKCYELLWLRRGNGKE